MHHTLNEFKLGANKDARSAGITEDTPDLQFRMNILAPRLQDNEYGTSSRTLIVSATAPELYEGSEIQLWLELPGLAMYKSSNWRVTQGAEWEEVFMFDSLFNES